MIPLALFILMLLKSMGFGMVPPKKTANLSSLQSIEQQQILVSKYPNYPILSTKDYRPVQSVQTEIVYKPITIRSALKLRKLIIIMIMIMCWKTSDKSVKLFSNNRLVTC
jgi:hypothetical protein